MFRRALFALTLLAAAVPSYGQTMYRCGNTFSQTPCGGENRAMSVPSTGAHAASVPLPQAQPCIAELAVRVGLADPKALSVGRIEGPKIQAIDYKGDKLVVRTYRITLNARNAYGGSTAAAQHTCHLSEDEQRVIALDDGTGKR